MESFILLLLFDLGNARLVVVTVFGLYISRDCSMMFDSHRKDGNQGLHVKHGHMVNYQMLERTWYHFVLGKQVERRTPSLKMQIKFFLLLLQGVGLNWTNRSSQRPTSLGLQDACLMYIIIIQVVSAREKAFIYNENLFFM